MCFVHPTDELCFSVTWSTPSSTRCPGTSEQERPAASLQVRALSACQMLPSSHHGNHSPTYSCSLSSTCPSNATGMKYQLHHYLSLQIKWSDVCVCLCCVSGSCVSVFCRDNMVSSFRERAWWSQTLHLLQERETLHHGDAHPKTGQSEHVSMLQT